MVYNYAELNSENLEYVPVADQEEIPNGHRAFFDIDEYSIVIFNIAGKLFAIADICSHDDGPVGDGELESEFEISCPRHGGRFDIRTGKATNLPAIIDIPAYPVRVKDGQVEVGIPLESAD
jgi:3-phenylpropionate/trans-cinnamate dioxygenase ferredoxin subunit